MNEGHRLRPGENLVIASHNRGKIPEFERLLQPLKLTLSCSADHGLPEPEETGDSFAENAAIKARAAATASGLPALADDSGLAVTALNGMPGIYSARWAGTDRNFAAAMLRIETELAGKSDRGARFISVLALCWPDGTMRIYTGEVKGTIIWPPRGDSGFGYDPIFMPNGHDRTFGMMSAAEKDRLSHRALACDSLLGDFNGRADDRQDRSRKESVGGRTTF